MGHCSAVVLQGIAGPDAAIGIIKMVAVGVPCAFLPIQMPPDDGPEPAHHRRVGIELKVPQQFVDVDKIHVVVVKLVVVFRCAADIAVRVHRRAPSVCPAGQPVGRVRQMGQHGGHARDLTAGIGLKMTLLPFGPAQEVARISPTPSGQLRLPAHGSVKPRLSVPGPVGRRREDSAHGIEPNIGRGNDDAARKCLSVTLGPVVTPGQCRLVGHGEGRGVEGHIGRLVCRWCQTDGLQNGRCGLESVVPIKPADVSGPTELLHPGGRQPSLHRHRRGKPRGP